MSIGQALYHRRMSLGLKQQDACVIANVSYDAWNRAETMRRRKPNLDTLELMAHALGCRICLVDERTGEEIE